MNTRQILFSLLIFALSLPAFAKKKNTPLPAPPHTVGTATNSNYVSALSAANRFLQAWQAQDHEAGLLLLTDSAKRAISEDQLEKMLSPGTSTPRAYQITRGMKLSTGRYAFPISLYEVPTPHKPRIRNSQVVVVRTGKDDWAIDKLP